MMSIVLIIQVSQHSPTILKMSPYIYLPMNLYKNSQKWKRNVCHLLWNQGITKIVTAKPQKCHFLKIISLRCRPVTLIHPCTRLTMLFITHESVFADMALTSSTIFCFNAFRAAGRVSNTLLFRKPHPRSTLKLHKSNECGWGQKLVTAHRVTPGKMENI
jgi:hypothetical protein